MCVISSVFSFLLCISLVRSRCINLSEKGAAIEPALRGGKYCAAIVYVDRLNQTKRERLGASLLTAAVGVVLAMTASASVWDSFTGLEWVRELYLKDIIRRGAYASTGTVSALLFPSVFPL